LIGYSPAHAAGAGAWMSDFLYRAVSAKSFAFQAAETSIKIHPGFFRRIFSHDRKHRTLFFNSAGIAAFAYFRTNKRAFHYGFVKIRLTLILLIDFIFGQEYNQKVNAASDYQTDI